MRPLKIHTEELKLNNNKCFSISPNGVETEITDKKEILSLFLEYVFDEIECGKSAEDCVPTSCKKILPTPNKLLKIIESEEYSERTIEAYYIRTRIVQERLISLVNQFTDNPTMDHSDVLKKADRLQNSIQDTLSKAKNAMILKYTDNMFGKDYLKIKAPKEFFDESGERTGVYE